MTASSWTPLSANTSPWKFSAFALFRQAARITWTNALVFFSWGWLPICLQMVVSLPYFKDATGGANAYSGRQLAKLVLGVGGYVLSVPFLIRVARYVILDEEPSCSYVRQFFQKTTWIYILKDVLVGIEYLVGLVLVGVFPCVLVWLIVGAGYVHSPRAVTSLVLLCAGGVLFGAVFFLAAQITLVRPAIAIGKVTSLLKIDTLGRPARMSDHQHHLLRLPRRRTARDSP